MKKFISLFLTILIVATAVIAVPVFAADKTYEKGSVVKLTFTANDVNHDFTAFEGELTFSDKLSIDKDSIKFPHISGIEYLVSGNSMPFNATNLGNYDISSDKIIMSAEFTVNETTETLDVKCVIDDIYYRDGKNFIVPEGVTLPYTLKMFEGDEPPTEAVTTEPATATRATDSTEETTAQAETTSSTDTTESVETTSDTEPASSTVEPTEPASSAVELTEPESVTVEPTQTESTQVENKTEKCGENISFGFDENTGEIYIYGSGTLYSNAASIMEKAEDERYNKEIASIKKSYNEKYSSIETSINSLKQQGYYTGSDSQYQNELNTLTVKKTNLEQQLAEAIGKSPYGSSYIDTLKTQIKATQDSIDKLTTSYNNKKLIDGFSLQLNDLTRTFEAQNTRAYEKHIDNLSKIKNAISKYGTEEQKNNATKKSNPIKVTVKKKTVKAKALAKKAQTIKAVTVKKAQGKVTFAKLKSGTTKKYYKKLTVNKTTGKVKLKKGKYTKGTIKLKVKIFAKGNSKYKSKTIKKTIKIKVK